MRKVLDTEKKLIATLRKNGQSIEFIKEKYKVTERQINSYIKKYGDDDTFVVSSGNKSTIKEEINNVGMLSEEYIMANHEILRQKINEKYETKKEFIKRQTKVPCIQVNSKDSDHLHTRFVNLEEIKLYLTEHISGNFWIYPDEKAFEVGELIYYNTQGIYVKSKVLAKKGFNLKKDGDAKFYYLSSPLKLYRGDRYKIVKQASYSLARVLIDNGLHEKKNRSEAFNQWLNDQGYL